jgi:hypothetical protein
MSNSEARARCRGGALGGLFLSFQYFSTRARAVMAAVRADGVGSLRPLAVRAGLDLDQREREMRTAASFLGLG